MENIISVMRPFWKKRQDGLRMGYLYSRDLPGSDKEIGNICKDIENILRIIGITTQEDTKIDDKDCINVFKYLVMNTHFHSQDRLTTNTQNNERDIQMYSMPPYLLIEILFFLWYEEIIAESVLHLPLNVTVELIDMSKKCLHNLDFDRRMKFLSLLLLNSYKRLNLIIREGALAFDIDDESKELMNLFDELMNFFSNDRIVELSKVRGLERSERIGFIMKNMLCVTSECLKCEESGIEPKPEMRSLYKLTYNNKSWKKVKKPFHDELRAFKHTFVENLWQQITMFNENIYNDWAKLEDPNCSMTLQQSICCDCYQLMILVKKCKKIKTDKLTQILEMIKPLNPDTETPDSQRTLQTMIRDLNMCIEAVLPDLANLYREWDTTTFIIVSRYIRYMTDKDFANLLEYYIHVMGKNDQEDNKRRVYTILSNTLRKPSKKSGCCTVLAYILMHNIGNTSLESLLITKEDTETLPKEETPTTSEMLPNNDLKSPLNLRMILISMLESPHQFLSILVKICIGHSEYKNVRATISPNDLMFLSPIMTARLEPGKKLLLSTLASITIFEDGKWDPEKWDDFVQVMLEKNIFTEDELINFVIISYFENEGGLGTIDEQNIMTMLKTLKKVFPESTKETSFTRLVIALAKKLTDLRISPILESWFDEVVILVQSIRCDMEAKISTSNDIAFRATYIEMKLKTLHPIDEYHFQTLISPNAEPDTECNFVFKSYEKRCSKRLARIQELLRANGKEINNFLIMEDYIRHFFVACAASEYVLFVESMIARDWRKCNYKNEYEAYDKIVNFTVETCAFHFQAFPNEPLSVRLPCLLKNLVKSTKRITGDNGLGNIKEIYDSLLRHLRKLDEWIEDKGSASYYQDFLSEINNQDTYFPEMENLETVLAFVDTFADKCLEHKFWFSSKSHSDRGKRYKIGYEFISELMFPHNVQVDFSSLLEIYLFLYPENQNA